MSLVTLTVTSNGAKVPDTVQVIAVDIHREVNRIPRANLTFVDGDLPKGEFPVSDGSVFELGAEIEIKLRYEGDPGSENSVFKGLVVRHGVEMQSGTGARLNVELKDKAIKLTRPRKSAVFLDSKDSDIISKLIGDAGLSAGTVAATQTSHKEMVQFDCSDWDFMASRADATGLLLVLDDGTVSAKAVDLSGSAKLTLEVGRESVYAFEFEADAATQADQIKSVGWDPKNQVGIESSPAKSVKGEQGNFDGKKLAGEIGFGPTTLTHMAPLVKTELQDWADATLARSRYALTRGRMTTIGVGDIQLLDLVTIKGAGKRFDGKGLVTGLRHRVEDGNWFTDLQFGLSPRPFKLEPDIVQRPAAGLLPGATGLQIGLVSDVSGDPDKEFRIKVKVPALGQDASELWARLASPYAGNATGQVFRPEVGDEVVIGFFAADPRHPVIVGSLHSSKNAPPDDLAKDDQKNETKGIVTKSGIKILWLDSAKHKLSFELPSKATLVLDDDKEVIDISDKHGNKITLDKDGITLKSSKDFIVDASGNVEVKGTKVDLK